jgi:hypothetical protein
MVLEPLLISEIYQQRYINSSTKTDSDGILEPLLITLSVVYCYAPLSSKENLQTGGQKRSLVMGPCNIASI